MIRTKILIAGDTVETTQGGCHVVADNGGETVTVRNPMTNEVFEERAVVVRPRYRTPAGTLMFGPAVGAMSEQDAADELHNAQPKV
jgi:hypothetical protein